MTDNARLEGLEGFVVKVFSKHKVPSDRIDSMIPDNYVESVFVVSDNETKAIKSVRESYKNGDQHEFTATRARQIKPGVYVLGNLRGAYPSG